MKGFRVASKACDERSTTIKILGLPVYRVIRDGFEVRTKFLGLTIGVRPDWQSIDETVSKFSSAIAERIANLEGRMSPEQKVLEQELGKIEMYGYIKKVQFGELSLENELKLVGHIAAGLETKNA